jgi:hypothetical protein
MDPKQIARQIVEFNKTAFDNSYTAISIMQDQMEKLVNIYFEQATWFPAEGKKLIQDWIAACKQGRDQYKRSAEEHFQKVEDFFAGKAKPKAGM